jgi:hypothetical protein
MSQFAKKNSKSGGSVMTSFLERWITGEFTVRRIEKYQRLPKVIGGPIPINRS